MDLVTIYSLYLLFNSMSIFFKIIETGDVNNVSHANLCTFINHYSYLIARKNKSLFLEFDNIYSDGIMLCLFLRIIGIKNKRISFDMTSLAPRVFCEAEAISQSIYFIGGEEGIAEEAVNKIMVGYPNLKVSGTRSGFFTSSLERKNVLDEIIKNNPDVIVASMGTPYQEQFLVDLKKAGWKGSGYTSGGFFHQTAKAGLKYYPPWVNHFNLRWAFRILDEPKLIRRYTVDFVKFVLLFSYDVFLFKTGIEKL